MSNDDKTPGKDANPDAPQVEVFETPFNLKKKLGGLRKKSDKPGFLDEKKIQDADALIEELCAGSYAAIGQNLENLTMVWQQMKDLPASEKRLAKTEEAFTLAHEIKDIGALCGYDLIAYFAESLRDYIAETALNMQNQQIIIQAHIDAMNTVHKKDLRKNAGPAAEELKRIVKIAVDKYK